MEFTGERFIPNLNGAIRLEHMHRYFWAASFVGGLDVLDIASGEGYGSYYLSDLASSVTGVDISKEAISYASATYVRNNLTFIHGDARRIPLSDKSIDVVVSFETLEHIAEHEEMLSEINRVLREDGFLIISTPNKFVYDACGRENNRFHIKELELEGFNALLALHFPQVAVFGQAIECASFISNIEGFVLKQLDGFIETVAGVNRGTPRLVNPTYFVAVASRRPVKDLLRINSIFGSIFYSETHSLWLESLSKQRQLSDEVVERDNRIAELYGAIADHRDRENALTNRIRELVHGEPSNKANEKHDRLTANIADLGKQVNEISKISHEVIGRLNEILEFDVEQNIRIDEIRRAIDYAAFRLQEFAISRNTPLTKNS